VAVLDQADPADRRASRRRPLHEIPRIAAVKVSSETVDVIDASSRGLLVEGGFPVRPGMSSYVDIIEAAGTSVRVNGFVVRCQIASIGANKLRYRFAIAFERAVPMIDEALEAGSVADVKFDFVIEDAAGQVDPAAQTLNNW
jgi:hypothetical protein